MLKQWGKLMGDTVAMQLPVKHHHPLVNFVITGWLDEAHTSSEFSWTFHFHGLHDHYNIIKCNVI